jgi:hypothetical protein
MFNIDSAFGGCKIHSALNINADCPSAVYARYVPIINFAERDVS